ncbi:calcium-binding protein [Thioclava sp. FR2]|uniref:calcium-binding protein n=1 Tax=Thioclava sp. FR2 TaxID=3445780 RepID=UPI003EBF3138
MPEPEIRIEGRPVFLGGSDTGFDHLYLVLVLSDGSELVLRAGAETEQGSGRILCEISVPMEDSSDARPPQDRALHGSLVLDLGGRDPLMVWALMEQQARAIDAAAILYRAFQQNSNSVIASLLYVVGIDIANVLPDQPNQEENYPASSNILDVFNFVLNGDAGDDLIRGASGSDSLSGGVGDDSLIGGEGRNWLLGEDGNDQIYTGSGGDFVGGGAGNDTIRGAAGNDTIYGGLGNDNLAGGGGNDQIFGSSGANIIFAGLGNDTVVGGSGNDTIIGGGGTNQLFGNDGNDEIYTSADGDFAAGGAGNDTIRGSAGDDTIYAGIGDDFIGGGSGNDHIFAGAGTNRIFGGLGDDTITAGVNRDVMSGGPGADSFVFDSSTHIGIGLGRDRITDFTSGQDRIDLSALNQTFNGTSGLIGSGTASFYYFASGGLLIGDQNGDGSADWVIELTDRPNLAAEDFLL